MIHINSSMIIEGDSRYILKELPTDFFQTCITSPPYWGLRDYGVDEQIGAEVKLEDYISSLVDIFEEVKRVLKPDGTFWLNIGDTYTSGNRGWRAPDKKLPQRAMSYRPPTPDGLKSKDLIGVPWRVAFALQNAGWYLRSEIIWDKPNANPESVKDRPIRSHEHIFLLAKNEKYYYDREATKEKANGVKRYKRSVWSINTEAFKEAHFATFPPTLIEPCILAGSHPSDYVLDPFFGSGTVGMVAKKLGRKFIGIEIHPEYIDMAKKRTEFVPQLSLEELFNKS
jgi:site-specific DNA-methyltransferase (cytosine-N4-specific)